MCGVGGVNGRRRDRAVYDVGRTEGRMGHLSDNNTLCLYTPSTFAQSMIKRWYRESIPSPTHFPP